MFHRHKKSGHTKDERTEQIALGSSAKQASHPHTISHANSHNAKQNQIIFCFDDAVCNPAIRPLWLDYVSNHLVYTKDFYRFAGDGGLLDTLRRSGHSLIYTVPSRKRSFLGLRDPYSNEGYRIIRKCGLLCDESRCETMQHGLERQWVTLFLVPELPYLRPFVGADQVGSMAAEEAKNALWAAQQQQQRLAERRCLEQPGSGRGYVDEDLRYEAGLSYYNNSPASTSHASSHRSRKSQVDKSGDDTGHRRAITTFRRSKKPSSDNSGHRRRLGILSTAGPDRRSQQESSSSATQLPDTQPEASSQPKSKYQFRFNFDETVCKPDIRPLWIDYVSDELVRSPSFFGGEGEASVAPDGTFVIYTLPDTRGRFLFNHRAVPAASKLAYKAGLKQDRSSDLDRMVFIPESDDQEPFTDAENMGMIKALEERKKMRVDRKRPRAKDAQYDSNLAESEREAVAELLQYLENRSEINFFQGEPLRALSTLVYSDNVDLQRSASLTFAEITERAENKVAIVSLGGLVPLIKQMNSQNVEVQCNAVGCITNLATHEENKAKIARSGALPPLTKLAKSRDMRVQRNATGALLNMTHSDDNRQQLVKAGAIPVLVQLLASSDVDVQYYCTTALSNIAVDAGNRRTLAANEARLVQSLVHLMESPSPKVQCQAALALRNLASDEKYQLEIVRAKGLQPLLRLLQSTYIPLILSAVACIRNISIHPQNESPIIDAGFLKPLVGLLGNTDNEEIQCHAISTLRNLAASSDRNKQLVLEAGAVQKCKSLVLDVPLSVQSEMTAAIAVLALSDELKTHLLNLGVFDVLIPLTDSESIEVQGNSAAALGNLSSKVGDYSIFVQSWKQPNGGIHGYLTRFVASGDSTFQHIAIWTLLQLLESGDQQLVDLISRSDDIVRVIKQISGRNVESDDEEGEDGEGEVLLPGDSISEVSANSKTNASNTMFGAGLQVFQSQTYASRAGFLDQSPGAVSVMTAKVGPKLPYVNATVLAHVTRITARQAHVTIVAVDDVPCTASTDHDAGFNGLIRVQDVRATEKDKVAIVENFSVGDVIRATVISIGDERNYYLSTARNDLGVVMAKSAHSGMPMFPVSWREVVDDRGAREARKVAKPDY
ncbi:MAG: hypothetical protein Q9159_001140 [Coniocarpon cinnabarinum]